MLLVTPLIRAGNEIAIGHRIFQTLQNHDAGATNQNNEPENGLQGPG